MAGAELNTIATEHGEYCSVSSATQNVIEHAAVFANHADGIATATEQVEHVVVSARSDAHVSADLATDVHLQANAREILMRLRQEIHVEFNNGMWWVMPNEFFRGILSEWKNGAVQVSFVWDWGGTRTGSYQCNGEETSRSRYIIEFQTMLQRNTDKNRTRRVKVVCIRR